MTVCTELATELRRALEREAFIYANSTDPANDLIPVPRYLVETAAEMLEISQSQVLTLRRLTLALAGALDEFLQATPFDHPNFVKLRQTLAQVEAMKVAT